MQSDTRQSELSFILSMQSKININIAPGKPGVYVHDARLITGGTINSCSGVRILRPKRGPGSAFVEGRKSDPNANAHVFRGALLSETSDRSQSNLEVSGHCARSF